MVVQYKADQTEYFLQTTFPKILWHGILTYFMMRNFQAIDNIFQQ
jgi:hypothetical protein